MPACSDSAGTEIVLDSGLPERLVLGAEMLDSGAMGLPPLVAVGARGGSVDGLQMIVPSRGRVQADSWPWHASSRPRRKIPRHRLSLPVGSAHAHAGASASVGKKDRMADEPRPTVLFDIDGTLVDTNYFQAVAWFRAFSQ